jgi:gas vesicle protein
MQLDSAASALIGAVIGGVIGVVGTAITAWTAARRERVSFERTKSQQHVDRVREAYDFALNVLFNMNRGGNPDRTSYGNVFARVSLHGSADVKRIVDAYIEAAPRERQIDLLGLIVAMKAHLSDLESARR